MRFERKFEKRIGYFFALLMVLLSVHCTGPNGRMTDTLALGGYRYAEVAEVKITAQTQHDPDKLAFNLQQGVQNLVDQSTLWYKGKAPTARIAVEVTQWHEPSDGAQFVGLDGYRIDYVIRAYDLASGQSRGVAHGTTKRRLRVGIAGGGLAGAIRERAFEQSWDNTTRQASINYALVSEVAGKLDRAKEREAVELERAPPTIARGVQVAASVVQK